MCIDSAGITLFEKKLIYRRVNIWKQYTKPESLTAWCSIMFLGHFLKSHTAALSCTPFLSLFLFGRRCPSTRPSSLTASHCAYCNSVDCGQKWMVWHKVKNRCWIEWWRWELEIESNCDNQRLARPITTLDWAHTTSVSAVEHRWHLWGQPDITLGKMLTEAS